MEVIMLNPEDIQAQWEIVQGYRESRREYPFIYEGMNEAEGLSFYKQIRIMH